MRQFLILGLLLFTGGLFSSMGAEAPESFKAGEFSFKAPKGWKWIQTRSRMRAAQLEVGEGEGKAEVIFYYFGEGGAGGTDANVARWLGQFKEPKDKLNSKVEEMKVGARRTVLVQAEGTYMSGRPVGPKTPKPGSMLFGAIMESSKGNVYVKMTGSKKTVTGASKAFRGMIEAAMK